MVVFESKIDSAKWAFKTGKADGGFYPAIIEYNKNIMASCKPNAILFTNGDNDTYPNWFLQFIDNYRQDITVVNLSLLNVPWYIKQLKNNYLTGTNNLKINLSDEDIDQLISWVWYGSWNITGEEQRWENGGWAALPPSEGTWLRGRWELAARYSNADIDRDLFDYGYTDYDPSTQECRTFSIALNWYPIPHTRVSLGWIDTIADDDLTTFGGSDRDSSFSLSLELRY